MYITYYKQGICTLLIKCISNSHPQTVPIEFSRYSVNKNELLRTLQKTRQNVFLNRCQKQRYVIKDVDAVVIDFRFLDDT